MHIMDEVEVRFVGDGVATLRGMIECTGPIVMVRFGEGDQTWLINAHHDRFQQTADGKWVLELR